MSSVSPVQKHNSGTSIICSSGFLWNETNVSSFIIVCREYNLRNLSSKACYIKLFQSAINKLKLSKSLSQNGNLESM